MKRELVITEQNGLFTIRSRDWVASAPTLEDAVIKAVQEVNQAGVPLDVTFKAAQVIDTLLGQPSGGQIHEGILAT
jgi:hypothetical protein